MYCMVMLVNGRGCLVEFHLLLANSDATLRRRVGPAPVVEPQPPEASMVDVVALDTPPRAPDADSGA